MQSQILGPRSLEEIKGKALCFGLWLEGSLYLEGTTW